MSRSRLLTIAVLGLLLINLATLAFIFFRDARPARDHRPPPGEGPKWIIIERLGFDATQQQAYEVLIKEHRRKSRELNHLSRELHTELFSLLEQEPADKQKAEAIMLEISLNQKKIDQLNFDHFLEIKALCKGEQVQRFNVLASDLANLFAPGPPH